MLLTNILSTLPQEFYVSGFNIVLPTVADALDIPSDVQVWPASVFSLVVGSFLLPFGRVADMYGGYLVFNLGLIWFLAWTVVAGFSPDYTILIVARAMQGFGPAAFLPTGIMILGQTYRPGPRKNLIFSLYGAFAPLGFYLGVIIGGVTGDLLSWRWYFWLGSFVVFACCLGGIFSLPRIRPQGQHDGKEPRMDVWGMLTTVPAIVLIVYAVTDGAHTPKGWATDYVIATFVLGVVLLAVTFYIEGWVSPQPLLPASLFKPKYMKTLFLSLTFAYGTFGVFLFYASF